MPGCFFPAFSYLGFGGKSIVITLIAALPLIGLIIYGVIDESRQILQMHMDSTRQHVEVARGALDWAYAQHLSGKLSSQEAQETAAILIVEMRYDETEYLWINDMEP